MSFEIEPSGPFSLRAAARFLAGFPPADRPGADAGDELELAFLLDSFEGAAAVVLREQDGAVHGDVRRGPEDAVHTQAARMLSLDVDGAGYAAVGGRDPVVGALQAARPGLRPVLYPSPYEAAALAIVSARVGGPQALAVRRRLCEEHGDAVGGLSTFPAPERLSELSEVRGLTAEKVHRLHPVGARAAARVRVAFAA